MLERWMARWSFQQNLQWLMSRWKRLHHKIVSDEIAHHRRYHLRENLQGARDLNTRREYGLHVTVSTAVNKLGKVAIGSIVKEMSQMHTMGVFTGSEHETTLYVSREEEESYLHPCS
jgi:hypothetical protein